MRAFICALLLSALIQPARAQSSNAPTYKLEGLASLMTNSVDYGVSQTTNDPALHGSFWFNWGPQFRLGLWGSNVAYENSDSHFLLKASAELKIDFSQNANMVISYSDHHYFKAGGRDGTVFGLKLTFWGYGINYEQISNYLGSNDAATAYSFTKSWDVFQTWKSENKLGYLMLDSKRFSNYFFVESFLGTRPSAIYYQVGVSYNSNASAFGPAGDLALILKASVGF